MRQTVLQQSHVTEILLASLIKRPIKMILRRMDRPAQETTPSKQFFYFFLEEAQFIRQQREIVYLIKLAIALAFVFSYL